MGTGVKTFKVGYVPASAAWSQLPPMQLRGEGEEQYAKPASRPYNGPRCGREHPGLLEPIASMKSMC